MKGAFTGRSLAVLLPLAIGTAFTGFAYGQVLYGSLTGNLTDASGAAIPNVKVEAANIGTGIVKQTSSDERGAFLFTGMSWKSKVVGRGSFRPFTMSSVCVDRFNIDCALYFSIA